MREVLQQMKVVFDLMASDEFIESVSTFAWKLYQSLKKKGFTDEQAIKIVTSMNRNSK